ncbi:MAG: TatD family deoxyribonuclease [Candidatus Thorarchaeota archaeon]|nr:MAG: TatD family deoxyribonuclease [Candidatus Thorarchaeota archaeon]
MEKYRLIDVHCHLEDSLFDTDRESVIRSAQEMGIAIISSAIETDTWEKGLEIADGNSSVFFSAGLNPTKYSEIDTAKKWILEHHDDLVAIGETGLDHYLTRDHKERNKQQAAFEELISIASDMKVPIQIHSRSAGRAALEVLENAEADRVHMHAFDGKASLARKASHELGYYFSIPTSVVRSPQKQKLVKAVNIERILIETDSPVLSPEKGLRNTPLNLPIVVQEVARILRRSEEELQEIVLENSLRLYPRISS